MGDEQKQRIFSILGWLNVLIFTPVLFITIIFNAQTYIMHLRTDKATVALLLYGIQLLLLLYAFIPSVLLQIKRSENYDTQMLLIVGFVSSCLLIFMILNTLMFHAPIHVYGGVFLMFVQSYIGMSLFLINIVTSMYLFLTNKIKFYINKSTVVLLFIFLCLIITLYILK